VEDGDAVEDGEDVAWETVDVDEAVEDGDAVEDGEDVAWETADVDPEPGSYSIPN
jgi:hypothetical protein